LLRIFNINSKKKIQKILLSGKVAETVQSVVVRKSLEQRNAAVDGSSKDNSILNGVAGKATESAGGGGGPSEGPIGEEALNGGDIDLLFDAGKSHAGESSGTAAGKSAGKTAGHVGEGTNTNSNTIEKGQDAVEKDAVGKNAVEKNAVDKNATSGIMSDTAVDREPEKEPQLENPQVEGFDAGVDSSDRSDIEMGVDMGVNSAMTRATVADGGETVTTSRPAGPAGTATSTTAVSPSFADFNQWAGEAGDSNGNRNKQHQIPGRNQPTRKQPTQIENTAFPNRKHPENQIPIQNTAPTSGGEVSENDGHLGVVQSPRADGHHDLRDEHHDLGSSPDRLDAGPSSLLRKRVNGHRRRSPNMNNNISNGTRAHNTTNNTASTVGTSNKSYTIPPELHTFVHVNKEALRKASKKFDKKHPKNIPTQNIRKRMTELVF
jgi:hypothetical protein